jgi:acyl-CoA reductase-like NAD-dependent aldehyde dehydrogenase
MAKTKDVKIELAEANGHPLAVAEEIEATHLPLDVRKTYKIYIGGQFPRTESGRFYKLNTPKGELLANMCLSSRKDFRNAVVAARKAYGGWAGRTAYNRSQILYRIAEMLEGRREQFVAELVALGSSSAQAQEEVQVAIDRLVHYAGWADKYQQLFSSVNPVASSHFNFSVLEPMGVVSIFAPEESGLLGLVSVVAPTICGGNACVVLASEARATAAVSFAEVLHTSDLPGGVVNILTGTRKELVEHFATHMDVNAFWYCSVGGDEAEATAVQRLATKNLKRVIVQDAATDWASAKVQNPYLIQQFQETKTTWHPIAHDMTGGGGAY